MTINEKLLSGTLLSAVYFSTRLSLQFWKNLSMLDLALSGVKGLRKNITTLNKVLTPRSHPLVTKIIMRLIGKINHIEGRWVLRILSSTVNGSLQTFTTLHHKNHFSRPCSILYKVDTMMKQRETFNLKLIFMSNPPHIYLLASLRTVTHRTISCQFNSFIPKSDFNPFIPIVSNY